jgi:hypothetical protein
MRVLGVPPLRSNNQMQQLPALLLSCCCPCLKGVCHEQVGEVTLQAVPALPGGEGALHGVAVKVLPGAGAPGNSSVAPATSAAASATGQPRRAAPPPAQE